MITKAQIKNTAKNPIQAAYITRIASLYNKCEDIADISNLVAAMTEALNLILDDSPQTEPDKTNRELLIRIP